MSALTLCYLIQAEVGIETNRPFHDPRSLAHGLQSELLGAHAAGVSNILALTGDPPSLGDYPGTTAVYDVDSIGLIRISQPVERGHRFGGRVDRADGEFHDRLRNRSHPRRSG